jgi:hypothetical protein
MYRHTSSSLFLALRAKGRRRGHAAWRGQALLHHMPDQAGTWLGTRRAKGLAPQINGCRLEIWKRYPAKGRG